MQYKATDGVLKYNIKTRNELLERHGGKYFMLDGQFEHPIGVAYDMTTRGVKHLTKEMPLQKFTMEDYSDYSDKIKWQYFNGIENLEIFETSGFTGEDFVRWHGGPYVEYITLDVGKEGKLNKDLGADTVIYHEGYDDTVTSDKQILGRSIYQSLVDLYSNETPYISVGRTPDDKEASLLGGVFDGFDEYGKVRDLVSYKSRLGNRVYNVYGESDVPTSIGYATTIDGLETNGRNRDTSKGFSWGNYQPNEFGAYTHSMNGVNNLLKKTDDLYNSHKIRTLFGRFHTSNDDDYNMYFESFDSAKVPNIGNPRGRGLFKLGVTSGNRTFQTNGYDNPYCRAWTYHHQYSRVKDLIRPLPSTSEGGRTIYEANVKYRSRIHNLDQGGKYLHQHTVLQDTGFVRITPSLTDAVGAKPETYGRDYKYTDPKSFTKLKKYMFSIENLAWGDGTSNNTRNLSIEQLGPNNGRIMWFPPYNIDFRENVSVKWNPHEFIGRGENIYTYSNTTRKGTLSFTLLIDHPALLNSMASGKYDGEGPDKDPEGDILRFFAGCQTPDPDADVDEKVPPDFRSVKKEEQTVGQPETVVEPTNEPVTPPVEPEEAPKDPEKIVFYVFFPNNYSGMWNNGQNLTGRAGEFNKNAPIDTDDNGICWYKYLLSGSNAGTSGNTKEGNGYEMKDGVWAGLSTQDDNKVDVIKSFIAKQNADYDVDTKKDKETENSDLWYRYRVDYDLRQSGLKHEKDNSSYYDSASFGLNSDLNVVHDAGKKDATCTFADVFSALFGLNYSSTEQCDNLKKVFDKGSGNVFNSITSIGGATKNDPTNANMLAMRRGRTVINTITNELNSRFPCNLQGTCSAEQVVGKSYDTINSLVAKADRYARIEISYNAATKTDNATTTTPIQNLEDNAETVNNTTQTVGADEPITKADYYENYYDGNPSYADMKANLLNIAGKTDRGDIYQKLVDSELGSTELYDNDSANKAYALQYENSIVARRVTSVDELSAANTTIRRYDDEYRFFKRLEKDSPIAFRKVVDKVKYFNPAFHSLSPEGFNARLTFLHQCTRQGHTISASESTTLGITATAGNLAFGKMPVCVLRLGDFINTRMIIESMSIDFKNGDGIQWDLNQEGAGVQPMFANVSLNIVLLGGQSLDGPINRLQNAVTFNYYANAPVYDDRADRITNNYDGTITYNHLFTPFTEGEF